MATTGFYKGTIFRLYSGAAAFVDATNCTFKLDTEMIDTSTKDTAGGGFRGVEPGEHSAEFTTETLIKTAGQSGKHIVDNQLARTSFVILMKNDETGDWELGGTAFCSSSQITAQNKQMVTGSFTFIVNGEITSALET
jgi:hypothetical protein